MNEHLLTSRQLVDRFRTIRKLRRMSVQTISDITGIPRTVLTNLEVGRRDMFTIDEACAVANALNVDLLACLQPEPMELIPAVTA